MVSSAIWIATIVGLLALLALDLFIVDRKPHAVTLGEATRWVLFYLVCALLFAVGIWFFAGPIFAGQFFAGYITEYSLSIDNLFVFVVLMSAFAVPQVHQHRVLLVGIVFALVLRGIFIAVGAAVIAQFTAVFYLFGAFLFYAAVQLARSPRGHVQQDSTKFTENALVRIARKILPVTQDYHGAKTFVRVAGRRMATPMLIVMIAIGTTDLLFAFDSIPAIFGLTQEPFLVFAANAFALMGLRQLYFLIGGLLNRLIYLSWGLATILGFIGVKLILEALHANNLSFINNGHGVPVPVIDTELSLIVIAGILVITTVTSLVAASHVKAPAVQNPYQPSNR